MTGTNPVPIFRLIIRQGQRSCPHFQDNNTPRTGTNPGPHFQANNTLGTEISCPHFQDNNTLMTGTNPAPIFMIIIPQGQGQILAPIFRLIIR